MAWFVVIGSGSWKSHKVEAESHIRHRKGVSFYNGKELVTEFPGHQIFRVMTCSSEEEADAAIEKAYTFHRGEPRDVISQLKARSERGKESS